MYERWKIYAAGKEIFVFQALNEKYMTDEETDSEVEGTFVKRSLTWRSVECDQLMKKVDERYVQQRQKKF